MKLTQMKQEGFTLIEILMVVLVIGILATIGITQFVNFGGDAKTAALKANLATLRNAIAAQNGLERIRCGKTSSAFPTLLNLRNNDITFVTAGAACQNPNVINPATGTPFADKDAINASYITLSDATFVANGIPPNPWSPDGSSEAQRKTVTAWTPVAGLARAAAGTDCAGVLYNLSTTAALAVTAGQYGYCYNAANGQIWANSASNNGLNTGTGNEAAF